MLSLTTGPPTTSYMSSVLVTAPSTSLTELLAVVVVGEVVTAETCGVGFEVEETAFIDVTLVLFFLDTGVVELPVTGVEDSLWSGGLCVGVSQIVTGSWETEKSTFYVLVDTFDCRGIVWNCTI